MLSSRFYWRKCSVCAGGVSKRKEPDSCWLLRSAMFANHHDPVVSSRGRSALHVRRRKIPNGFFCNKCKFVFPMERREGVFNHRSVKGLVLALRFEPYQYLSHSPISVYTKLNDGRPRSEKEGPLVDMLSEFDGSFLFNPGNHKALFFAEHTIFVLTVRVPHCEFDTRIPKVLNTSPELIVAGFFLILRSVFEKGRHNGKALIWVVDALPHPRHRRRGDSDFVLHRGVGALMLDLLFPLPSEARQ